MRPVCVEESAATPEPAGLVVIDLQGDVYGQNRILDPEYALAFPGFKALASLGVWLRERGIESVTADVFLRQQQTVVPTACLSVDQTQYTREILSRPGVIPAVCLSLESPIMIMPFYQAIPELSKRYGHMFLWPGARDRATGGARFHEVSWPYPPWAPTDNPTAWHERKFLVLVSGNKRAFPLPRPLFDAKFPRASLRALRSYARTSITRARDPWFRTELYVDRLRAIEYFSRTPGFDLYGRGWREAESTLSARAARAVAKSYRGEIPPLGKIPIMSEYRFALCYENTSFSGYLTEKLFDCFAAGCIPIYRGAPDIAAAVPRESFIDGASFGSLRELDRFLTSTTPEEASGYLKAAHDFMASSAASRFAEGTFVQAVGEALVESLHGSQP